jgi:pimeloyl-ACP methyl ester carboxylesterase
MFGRLAFFRAEVGLVSLDARATVEGAGGMFIEIPGAGHAPMLDQPIALVTGIRAVLAAWDSESHLRRRLRARSE